MVRSLRDRLQNVESAYAQDRCGPHEAGLGDGADAFLYSFPSVLYEIESGGRFVFFVCGCMFG